MNQQHKIHLLRISFWIGAIIDALVAIQLLIPRLLVILQRPTNDTANGALNLHLYTAAALMMGWTGTTIWADRKPTPTQRHPTFNGVSSGFRFSAKQRLCRCIWIENTSICSTYFGASMRVSVPVRL